MPERTERGRVGPRGDSLEAHALEYQKRGWSVIPIQPQDKRPLVKWEGAQKQRASPEQIHRWWSAQPSANIGIVTGRISGIIVLDLDQKGSLNGRPIPPTPQSQTGHGQHFVFSYPDQRVPNKARLETGMDIRGDGGYFVAPPSIHPNGKTYQWIISPDEEEPAPCPSWVRELLDKAIRPHNTASAQEQEGLLRALVGASEGERNELIFRYACRLRAKGLAKEEAQRLILEAAKRAEPGQHPFTEEEALACLESAWKYPSTQARWFKSEDDHAFLIERGEQALRMEWTKDRIYAHVRSLKERSDGRITGMLTIGTTVPGEPTPIHQAMFNFTSTRTRKELGNILKEEATGLDWYAILEMMCREVIQEVQKGDPVVQLSSRPQPMKRPQYLLAPFILQESPSILFGERSTAKSYTAALLAYLCALGPRVRSDERGLILRVPAVEGLEPLEQAKPLYLDWELSDYDLAQRLSLLSQGLDLPEVEIPYRRCHRALADDAGRIRDMILEEGIELVIVDSLGPACSGDLNSAEAAMAFFNGIRALRVPAFILAHTAKHSRGSRSIFGSVFFENLARSIWEVQAEQEPGDQELGVSFRHRKNSFGPLEPPIGLRFSFSEEATVVERTDIMDIPGGEKFAPTSDRIAMLLKREGAMTVQEIAQQLSLSQEAARSALRRGFKRKFFTRLAGRRWGVAEYSKEELL